MKAIFLDKDENKQVLELSPTDCLTVSDYYIPCCECGEGILLAAVHSDWEDALCQTCEEETKMDNETGITNFQKQVDIAVRRTYDYFESRGEEYFGVAATYFSDNDNSCVVETLENDGKPTVQKYILQLEKYLPKDASINHNSPTDGYLLISQDSMAKPYDCYGHIRRFQDAWLEYVKDPSNVHNPAIYLACRYMDCYLERCEEDDMTLLNILRPNEEILKQLLAFDGIK